MKRFDDKKIKGFLDTDLFGRRLIHLQATTSTNDYCSALLDDPGPEGLKNLNGTLVLSDEQTGGRGRFNRQWVSPPGGLWFSLLFRTGLSADKIPSITLIAAYSAAETLMQEYAVDVIIKWPNDLYFKNSKFGGILSEEKESGPNRYVIMGMGLNINIDKDLLEGLENDAANLQDIIKEKIEPEKILAGIINRFEKSYLYYSNTGDLDSIFKKIEKILRF